MKRKAEKFIVILFGLCIIMNAYADGDDYPLVKAIVSPKDASIGTPLEYRVNVTGEDLKDIEIVLPDKRELYPEPETIVKKKDSDEDPEEDDPSIHVPVYVIHNARKEDRSEKSMDSFTVVLQMSYYRPGKYSLPEIEIFDRDKIKIGYRIPEIEVKGLNEKGELQDIEAPLDLGGNYYRVIFLILGVAAFTALSIFLYKYLKKRREELMNAPVVVPPIEIFLKDIEGLDGRSLINQGKIEKYVFGISMIFRKFISALLSIDATEMTTEEIRLALKNVIPVVAYKKYEEDIMKSFQLLDLAKFAEFMPSEEILFSNLELMIRLAKNLSRDMWNDSTD